MRTLDAPVQALMRQVGAELLVPRFRQLSADEIMEKSPGDLVTVVDRESEVRLTDGLAALLPGSHVVGEEACAADPALLAMIGDGAVWIVDPLDGTANYAAGRTPFAIMVALAEAGTVRAGWILDPITGRMVSALRGHGAFVDSRRVAARGSGTRPPVAALATRYLPEEVRADIGRRSAERFTLADIPGCAGEQYPRLVMGQNDVALFWRALPWDHAPGALFLEEAGGRIAHIDGTPYSIAAARHGLLAAASPALWDEAADALFG